MKEKISVLSLADLAFDIANEQATQEDGKPLIANGKPLTKAERILRQWGVSDNPVLQTKFMELALKKSVEIEAEKEKPKGLSAESAAIIRMFMLGIRKNEDDEIVQKAIESLEPGLRENMIEARRRLLDL